MAVVDEFATDKRQLGRNVDLTTKSAVETRSLDSPLTRRVVSANVPRSVEVGRGPRVRSAEASMAVVDSASVVLDRVCCGYQLVICICCGT